MTGKDEIAAGTGEWPGIGRRYLDQSPVVFKPAFYTSRDVGVASLCLVSLKSPALSFILFPGFVSPGFDAWSIKLPGRLLVSEPSVYGAEKFFSTNR